MESDSVIKLQKAGYSFLRVEERTDDKTKKVRYIIKYSNEFGSWKKLNEYPSKAATKRELDRLIKDENLKYLF
jgi:hypothetical protein